MRFALLSIIDSLLASIIVLVWLHHVSMKRQLSGLDAIRNQADLDLFKWAVARDMYVSMIAIACIVASVGIFVIGLSTQAMSFPDIAFVLPLGIVFGIGGAWIKKYEAALAQLPVDAPALSAERDCVVHVWHHRPFPDWN